MKGETMKVRQARKILGRNFFNRRYRNSQIRNAMLTVNRQLRPRRFDPCTVDNAIEAIIATHRFGWGRARARPRTETFRILLALAAVVMLSVWNDSTRGNCRR